MVRLEVFNVLGQPIALLLSGSKAAGFHEVLWDASRATSGKYLCRLTAESNGQVRTETMRMLLMR
jgi:hypothetical protein